MNYEFINNGFTLCVDRADSSFAPSQWETSLQSNDVSHWLVANLELNLCRDNVGIHGDDNACGTFVLMSAR